nr:reverse transcriptase domain, reverse transcriptase zinc-binding domain protein [Tanacetum cinerariifolium]
MGDQGWTTVNHHKGRSVFDRLDFSQTRVSDVDDLVKISTSVYLTNFPSHLTRRELWNICSKAGKVVDVFIARRLNKAGLMYAFCRFIKVDNTDALVDSLCKIRIGKMYLHANVARFARNSTPKVAIDDFVSDERIVWVDIEGVPLNAWSRETFLKIGKKWGEALDMEDNSNCSFGRKRL